MSDTVPYSPGCILRHSALLSWLQLNNLETVCHQSSFVYPLCGLSSFCLHLFLYVIVSKVTVHFMWLLIFLIWKTLISSTSRLLWGWTFHLLWKFLLSRNVTSWPDGKCEECNRLPLHFNYVSKKQFRKTDLENGLKLAPTGSRALSAEKD